MRVLVVIRYPGESWDDWRLTATGRFISIQEDGLLVVVENVADGDLHTKEAEKREKAESARAKKMKKAKAKAERKGEVWEAPPLRGCFWQAGKVYVVRDEDVANILVKHQGILEQLRANWIEYG